jgi:hypothetical protein
LEEEDTIFAIGVRFDLTIITDRGDVADESEFGWYVD